jgi:hypothetical protein
MPLRNISIMRSRQSCAKLEEILHLVIVKGIIKQILLATCLIGATTCEALAAPFHFNPQSFQDYLNSIRWDDGSQNKFQNLTNCNGVESGNMPSYYCRGGYVYSSSPMGNRVCRVDSVMWSPGMFQITTLFGGKSSSPVQFSTGECRNR